MKTILLRLFFLLCAVPHAAGQAPSSPQPKPVEGELRVTTVAKGLEHPWALEFLPDGRMLVSERPGRLRVSIVTGAFPSPWPACPKWSARRQGGLLDIALSPSFAQDRLIYFSFAEEGEGGAGTAVARAVLAERALEKVQVIWRQMPKVKGDNHFGSRLRVWPRRQFIRYFGRSLRLP